MTRLQAKHIIDFSVMFISELNAEKIEYMLWFFYKLHLWGTTEVFKVLRKTFSSWEKGDEREEEENNLTAVIKVNTVPWEELNNSSNNTLVISSVIMVKQILHTYLFY